MLVLYKNLQTGRSMRQIVTIKFGSHLYGTATPQSDLDFKGVYIPCARDILLQRVKGSVSEQRQKAEKEKNLPGEVDRDTYSLQRFLGLVAEGQTVALDILFAPEWAMPEAPQPEWLEIAANRPRLLTRKSAAFLGYCRQQANKFAIVSLTEGTSSKLNGLCGWRADLLVLAFFVAQA